jgi:DNA-binding CsgD family transcriptional regulator
MTSPARGHAAERGVGVSDLGARPGHSYPDHVHVLERDHELAVLRAALAGARAGQGRGVAVSGDAGTGKSTLVEAACGPVGGTGGAADLRLLRGACDPLRTPRPLGPFRDVAGAAGLGPLLRDGDALLAHVCEELYGALGAEPTVLVVEDLHWVDAASVDVLRFLVRRMDSMPIALLVTYRDHEVGPRHSARPLLGDFARLDGLDCLRLNPLSVDGVRTLVEGSGLDPLRVHELTGGNPFFVTEVVKDPDRPLPGSVRDAILARTAAVAFEDFEVLQLVAMAPDRIDDRTLPALGVDLPTLRRLDATGLLGRTRGGLVFRHELARQAVESTVPPGGVAHLHARLLEALERIEPREPAVLTHHAVAAGDAARAARYARAAADEAARAGSHSEAAAFLRTALDHVPEATPGERADLLQRLSFEQYMTSQLAEAIDNVRATFPLWQRAEDPAGLAAAHDICAVFEYYNARRVHAEAHADRAAGIADRSGAELAYGVARATRGFLAYMRSDVDLALRCSSEASRVADEYEHAALGLKAEFVRALVDLVGGSVEARGWLSDHVEEARSQGWDELASTGYSQLSNLDVEHRRLRAAEHVLDESLPFTIERDIPICQHWQTGVRSRLRFAQGRWSAALEDADYVLDEDGMPLATVWPNLVRALVPLRRGSGFVRSHLDAAWTLAAQIDEPLRTLAVYAALAEAMWMTGVADPRVTDNATRELDRIAGSPGSEWGVGELAAWLVRLRLIERPSDALRGSVAEPYRTAFVGRFAEAASWWRQAGEPFAEAMTLGDAPDPALRTRAVELFDRLGATATADRHRVALRQDGITQLPARPRERTRANPAGLTNRQLDVARLVARGFTNAEIAARLYISIRTADHHVSAVLTKMGLPNRRAVVVQADELGLS